MTSSYSHQLFGSYPRVSQSLRNDRCQNILYKAVFEHFIKIKNNAALLLTSKSFQNSSFGANFLVNFVVDKDSILLLETVLSPSSCFSLQFVPSLHINQRTFDKINRGNFDFVRELVNTKYFYLSLRSLTLDIVTNKFLSFFCGNSSPSWPQLSELRLENCDLNDSILELIAKNAVHLRAANFSRNSGITDSCLQYISKLSEITSLRLCGCGEVTDAGLEQLRNLSGLTCLNLAFCNRITDFGLETVSEIVKITSLDLSGCYLITNAGLKLIRSLSNLIHLNISFCINITDVGLEHISKFSCLTLLDMRNCNLVTAEATAKLKIALPKCTIVCESQFSDNGEQDTFESRRDDQDRKIDDAN